VPTGGRDSDDGGLRDYPIYDDLILTGSACVGFDCATGESFGYDTIRLKEHNLRIHFHDTSNTSSYPTNDWRIEINSSVDGGDSYFAVMDVDAGRYPFRIEAGAYADALVIDGRHVGFGTSNPAYELHSRNNDTPTLRLEQDTSGGWPAQTWDIGGNEYNFFIRDATGGSDLPFRIRAGAPSNSLYLQTNGNTGLGTDEPAERLHVAGNVLASQAGTAPTLTVASDTDTTLALDASGNLFLGGVLFEASSRELKENLTPVDGPALLDRVSALPLWEWNYVADERGATHVGPVAEDFAAAFGLGADDEHLAALDVSGVALGAVQELEKQANRKDARIAELEARLAAQERERSEDRRRIDLLLARLETLEAAAAER
jgi:hypothetical protein